MSDKTNAEINAEIIKEAMANHDKHYRCLVLYIKRYLPKSKRNAFTLCKMLGEGSQVAHAIWKKYEEKI